MGDITLTMHYWALLSRGERRFKANHLPPDGVVSSLNLKDSEPKPGSFHDGDGPVSFNADAVLSHKAIWPVGLDANGKPTPQDWNFLFWVISGLKGGTLITTKRDPEIALEAARPDKAAEPDAVIQAIAWYGTYGFGPGSNGVRVDAFSAKDNLPIDDDFVIVQPKELDATKGANDTGLVNTDWKFDFSSASLEASSKIQKLPFKEWVLPNVAGDIKILWGPDGKPVKDSAGKPIEDPSALAVAPNVPSHVIAKKHVQGFAFAFYAPPPEHEQPVVDVITKPGPIDHGVPSIAESLGDILKIGIQGIAGVVQTRFSEFDRVLERLPSMANHEVHQWLADIRMMLARLSESEKSLLSHLKDRGK